jgi:hypothetical protein
LREVTVKPSRGAAKNHVEDVLALPRSPKAKGPQRAELEGLTPDGQVLIRQGNRVRTALLALATSDVELVEAIRRRGAVLIDHIDGNLEEPVVVALLRDRLSYGAARADSERAPTERVVEIAAEQSIVLRVGRSTLELREDGRIELHGVEVVSIADGTNRLLGAKIALN